MKMSKSGCVDPTIENISLESRIRALESERDYWRTRHDMLMKYGPHTVTNDEINTFLDEVDDDNVMRYPTDMEDAIIGTIEHITLGEVLLLDKAKCLQLLEEQGMDDVEAIEFFYYNTLGSYMEGVPAYATFIN